MASRTPTVSTRRGAKASECLLHDARKHGRRASARGVGPRSAHDREDGAVTRVLDTAGRIAMEMASRTPTVSTRRGAKASECLLHDARKHGRRASARGVGPRSAYGREDGAVTRVLDTAGRIAMAMASRTPTVSTRRGAKASECLLHD